MGIGQKIVRKGVRGEGPRGIVGQGDGWKRNASARVASNCQKLCYHRSIVHVKINLRVGWKRLKKKEIARNGSDKARVTEIGRVFCVGGANR